MRQLRRNKSIKEKDITDGHTDFYTRFIKQAVVVVIRDTEPRTLLQVMSAITSVMMLLLCRNLLIKRPIMQLKSN
jgi:hypothetical protein